MKKFLTCCLLLMCAASFAAGLDDAAAAELDQLYEQIGQMKESGQNSAQLWDRVRELKGVSRTTTANLDDTIINGNCSDVIDLGSLLGEVSGSTFDVQNSYGPFGPSTPACWQGPYYYDDEDGSSGEGPDVAYKWAAPADGEYTFSTCNDADYDTGIELFNFTCPNEPVFPNDFICGNDDGNGCSGFSSRLSCIELSEGQEVLVVVDGYDGAFGDFTLTISECEPEPECFDMAMVAPGNVSGNTDGAGNDCDLRSSEETIVKVTIPHDGEWTFSLCGSEFNTYLYLGTGCCRGDIGSNNDGCTYDYRTFLTQSVLECVSLLAGDYFVTIEGRYSHSKGAFTLDVSECVVPPCFDMTLNAPGSVSGTTEGAGNDCYFRGSEEVVVKVDIPFDGLWTFSLCGSDYDTYMYLGTNCCWGDIAWDNDGCNIDPDRTGGDDDGPKQSLIECVELTAGEYYVTIEGKHHWDEGDFVLDVFGCNPPFDPVCEVPTCVDLNGDLCVLVTGPDPADPDGDDVSYEYHWYIDDDETAGFVPAADHPTRDLDNLDGSCVPANKLEVGDLWKVVISAVDEHGNYSQDRCMADFPEVLEDCFSTPCPEQAFVDLGQTFDLPVCRCLDICEGVPLTVCVGPLAEDQMPDRWSITPGCAPTNSGCDVDCDPAQPTIVSEWVYNQATQTFCMTLVSSTAGCFCFCLDEILPVELNELTAVAGDRQVSLNWSTASETNSDRFEILRNGTLVGQQAADNSASGSSYRWTDRFLTNGTEYSYRLVSVDLEGVRTELATVSATPTFEATEVTEFALHQNYPNPFNPETQISFDIAEAVTVKLGVYNLLGQQVAELVNGSLAPGRHNVTFQARDLPSGMYLYRMEAGDFVAQHKMLLMK